MTHTREMADDEGTFDDWRKSREPCRKCGANTVTVRLWESNDGAYDDYQFRCACGHTWWVEGIDS